MLHLMLISRSEMRDLKAELAAVWDSSAREMQGQMRSATDAAAAAEAAYVLQLEQRLEIEKEKRVAHLQQQGARRIANAGIAKGFTTWEEAARQKRMLAAAAGRLARPALAAAVAHWVNNWRVVEGIQAKEDAARRVSSIEE